jgi:hypothetical protein
MKLPGIFELTTHEQRAVILIVIALLVAGVVKRYHDQQTENAPPKPAPAQVNAMPSMSPSNAEVAKRDPP